MGKLQKFEITFDNPSAVYFAGQTITGTVIIILSEHMNMQGVDLTFRGGANVDWEQSEKDSETNDWVTYHYSASETYFDHEIPLMRKDQESLSAGEHFFPFAYTLPISAPSSFEGVHGSVRYYCKAKINRPWKFDSVCKMPFTVNSLLDLNREVTAREPITREKHKTFCCLCCASGPLSFVVRIDRTGYVPGESIAINAEIDNLSDKKISCSSAVLRTKITYHAEGQTNSEKKEIAEIKHGSVPAGQSDAWSGELMPIPPLPPSFLGGCQIIEIEYYVEFCVEPSGLGFDLSVTMPILIGTIPLYNNFANFQLPTPAVSNIVTDSNPSAPPLPLYPNIPPPSYAECAFGEVNIRDKDDNEYTYGKLNYAPAYTYYKTTTVREQS